MTEDQESFIERFKHLQDVIQSKIDDNMAKSALIGTINPELPLLMLHFGLLTGIGSCITKEYMEMLELVEEQHINQ